MPYPKQSLRSLLLLLITITTPNNLRLLLSDYWFFLLLSRLLKNFCYLRSLKDQIKSFSSENALIWLFWWRLTGSNRRPPACKAGALPAELNPHLYSMVGLVGLEPTTPALSTRCSNQLSYRPFWISISATAYTVLSSFSSNR